MPVSNPLRLAWLFGLLLYFGINYRFLRVWFGDIELHVTVIPCELAARLAASLRQNPLLAGFLALFFVLHLYPITRPIAIGEDEAYHAWYVLGLVERASVLLAGRLGISFLAFLRLLSLALVIGVVLADIARRDGKVPAGVKTTTSSGRALLLLASIIGLIVYFALLRGQLYDTALHRYPPLGKIAVLLSHTLFGVTEFAARFPSLLFSFLSGIYVFRTVRLYYERETAILASCVLFLIPSFFYYGNLAYLEMGVIFFMSASGFHFLRHLEQREDKDLVLAMFFLGVGFLYKQYSLALLPVYAGYVAFRHFVGGDRARLSLYLKAGWMAVATMLPWRVAESALVSGGFFPSNLLSLEIATRYARNLPAQVTYPIVALFVAGLVWGSVRRETLIIYCGIVFGALYVLMTCLADELWVGVPRFMTVLFPAMAMVGAVFARVLVRGALDGCVRGVRFVTGRWVPRVGKTGWPWGRQSTRMAYAVLLGFLVWRLPVDPVGGYGQFGFHYFVALDDVFRYVKDSIPAGGRWVSVSHFAPIAFYKYKYEVDMTVVGDPSGQWGAHDAGEFGRWMNERAVDYALVILPAGLRRARSSRLALSGRLQRLLAWERRLLEELDATSTASELVVVKEFQSRDGTVRILKRLDSGRLDGRPSVQRNR